MTLCRIGKANLSIKFSSAGACSSQHTESILAGEMIPIIDLFAGPGGLGEGFSALKDRAGNPVFKIGLSVEKDPIAHQTLKLRSFFRQFSRKDVPEEYYDHLRARMDKQRLYELFPAEAAKAHAEAWNTELGNASATPIAEIDRRIKEVLGGTEDWVLIGGPPCQAYSLVGRSRVIPVDRRDGTDNYEKDQRHFLYKAYLRIIAAHAPPVFVMENVKGILSAKVGGKKIIERLLSDLRYPSLAVNVGSEYDHQNLEYDIRPLADYDQKGQLFENISSPDPADYIVRSEEHHIPQARHRFILLGVRTDRAKRSGRLRNHRDRIAMWQAISDLPRLRSKLSREEDSGIAWVETIRQFDQGKTLKDRRIDEQLRNALCDRLKTLSEKLPTGAPFLQLSRKPKFQAKWFHDPRLGGICNHVARGHMDSDLWRYFFIACYGLVYGRSPKLSELPTFLLPDHDGALRTGRGMHV